MAKEQQAFITHLVIEHLQQANEETRRAFAERYERRIFPLPQLTTTQTKWRSHRNIVRVTLWGRDYFWNNIRVTLVHEALGLGPQYYCIMSFVQPGFAERVFL